MALTTMQPEFHKIMDRILHKTNVYKYSYVGLTTPMESGSDHCNLRPRLFEARARQKVRLNIAYKISN